jgi:phospholipid/cholesterol/gamma-HCH transport system substrate-binding protein
MENRSHALMAGFFTIGLLVATVLIAIWFGRDKIQRTPYEIATKMEVSGLNLQAAVRYKGIKVGSVTAIDFDPKTPGVIIIRLEVMDSTPITKSTYATLGYQGVTGIAYILLDDDGSQSAPLLLSDSSLPRIPLKPGLFQDMQDRGIAILTQTEELTKRLNLLLDPKNQQSVTAAVDNISKTAAAWQSLPSKIEPTLNKLPALSEQAQQTLASVKQVSDSAGKLSTSLNQLSANLQAPNGPLAKLNDSVDQISSGLTYETLPKVNVLTSDARATFRNLNRTAESLNERPQSILFGKPAPQPGPGEPGFSGAAK